MWFEVHAAAHHTYLRVPMYKLSSFSSQCRQSSVVFVFFNTSTYSKCFLMFQIRFISYFYFFMPEVFSISCFRVAGAIDRTAQQQTRRKMLQLKKSKNRWTDGWTDGWTSVAMLRCSTRRPLIYSCDARDGIRVSCGQYTTQKKKTYHGREQQSACCVCPRLPGIHSHPVKERTIYITTKAYRVLVQVMCVDTCGT